MKTQIAIYFCKDTFRHLRLDLTFVNIKHNFTNISKNIKLYISNLFQASSFEVKVKSEIDPIPQMEFVSKVATFISLS